ncbi:early boundary activity 1 [Cochliomyia hominivorax]
MTEIMQHPVNIRKRRIMEAFNEEPIEKPIDKLIKCLDLSTARDDISETTNDLEKKFISTDRDQLKLVDMKLKVLETWEVSKRNGIEKLVKDVEELQELEEQIEKLEDSLMLQNIEINEEEFEIFYQKQMVEKSAMEPMDVLTELQPQTPKRQEKQAKRIKISATSTPISRKPIKTKIADKFEANEDGMVTIGPNGTMISKAALQAINWSLSGAALTRKILMEVFGRETLAFHTLTGKPSPAFMDCDKPMKNQLDPLKVTDIIHLVMQHTELTAKEVRNAITTKCADENKMFRQREKKRLNAALKLQQQEEN